jgi:hypothetical protein
VGLPCQNDILHSEESNQLFISQVGLKVASVTTVLTCWMSAVGTVLKDTGFYACTIHSSKL